MCHTLRAKRAALAQLFGLMSQNWLKNMCFAAFMEGLKIHFVISHRYYNWNTAAPLVLAMQAFQKPLPKVRVDCRRCTDI